MLRASGYVVAAIVLAGCARRDRQRDATASVPSGGAEMMNAAEQAMTGRLAGNPHLELTPLRPVMPGDSARAALVADELRTSLARYRDTTAAVADGYAMFAPQIKGQRLFHFTSNRAGLKAAFTFDAASPTSLLYEINGAGQMVLVGGMYTARRGASLDELDSRVPLSIAQWHRHVRWCVPERGESARWAERKNGKPLFGPDGVATKGECSAARGRFFPVLFGWMVHARLGDGTDPTVVWGDAAHHHGGGDLPR
ncbi:MAG: hypothetical protein NVS1B4_24120 [Gemmatimonadaceae bacterium]